MCVRLSVSGAENCIRDAVESRAIEGGSIGALSRMATVSVASRIGNFSKGKRWCRRLSNVYLRRALLFMFFWFRLLCARVCG